MNDLDRILGIIARRDWFHLNDAMNIVYCTFDDRGNCHSEFHASTETEVRKLVLSSPIAESFANKQRSLFKSSLDTLRSAQISANVRGDRDEDITLFNTWSDQSRQTVNDGNTENTLPEI